MAAQFLGDLDPGQASSFGGLRYLMTPGAGHRWLFAPDVEKYGGELWTTDGTAQGTSLLRDFRPGPDYGARPWVVLNGISLFTANDWQGHVVLGRTDGTAAGTSVFASIEIPASHFIAAEAPAGNQVFFLLGSTEDGWDVWRTDGTAAGTYVVNPVDSRKPITTFYNGFVEFRGEAFFSRDPTETGAELWKSDGTAAGTMLVSDIVPGPKGSNPHSFAVAGNFLYFLSHDFDGNESLWKTDGTSAGTVMVGAFGFVHEGNLAAVGDTLYYMRNGSSSQLMKVDGTAASAVPVKTFAAMGSWPKWMTPLGDRLLFVGDDGASGFELWTTDGTSGGTVRLKDIQPGAESGDPRWLLQADATHVFFTAGDAAHGRELWVTDGTPGGTRMVEDVRPGAAGSDPVPFTYDAAQGALFFSADDGVHGRELWTLRTNFAPPGPQPEPKPEPQPQPQPEPQPKPVPPPAVNRAPVAQSGGPYSIAEGGSLALDASGSSDPDGDPLTFTWDANGDGVFADAAGVKPRLTWEQLRALGVRSSASVRVRADDGHGHVVTSAAGAVTVRMVKPTVAFGGYDAPAGAGALTFTLVYSDDFALDEASFAAGAGQVHLSGPGGFLADAEFVSAGGDGAARRTVTYRAAAPGGAIDFGDVGTYAVVLDSGAATDSVGNATGATMVGGFYLSLPLPGAGEQKPPVGQPQQPDPPAGAPSLSAAVVGRVPAEVMGGGRGKVSVALTNDGSQPASGAGVSLYLSADGSLDGGDVKLAALAGRGAMKPGKSKRYNLKFAYPADLPDGSYTLLAAVDGATTATVGPTVHIRRPVVDLAASLPTAPSSLARGGKGAFSVAIQNTGTDPGRGGARVRLIASLDGTPSADDRTLADVTVPVSLKAGKSKAYKLRFTTPLDLAAGSYTVLAVVEPAGTGDANAANDVAQAGVQVV